ncbi:MAG TPA: FHA domain-containing protein [Anaerolineaceae bacterium]
MMAQDYFELLGIPRSADDRQIWQAYMKKRAETAGDRVMRRQVELAYSVLSMPGKRKKYLEELETASPGKTAESGSSNRPSTSQPGREISQPGNKPATKPAGADEQRSKRDRTEVFDMGALSPVRTPSHGQESAQATGQPPSQKKGSGREKTEVFDAGELVRKPTQPIPEHPAPKPSGSREKTEVIDTGVILNGLQQGKQPVSPSAAPPKRDQTDEIPLPPTEDRSSKKNQSVPPVIPPEKPSRQKTEVIEIPKQVGNAPISPAQPEQKVEPPVVTLPDARRPTGGLESSPPAASKGASSVIRDENAREKEIKAEPVISKPPVVVLPPLIEEKPIIVEPVIQPEVPPVGEKKSVQVSAQSSESIQHPVVYSITVTVEFKGKTEVYQLQEGENLVGRPAKDSIPAVPLPDPERFISRRHAKILVNRNGCQLVDLGSDNGTTLNRVRLTPNTPYPLKNHDLIVIEDRQIRITIP